MSAVQEARRRYAAMLRDKVPLRSEALVRAFAEIPREAFLGPAPWRILGLEADNPIDLYDDVLVPIDETRSLMNGMPSFIAGLIDALDLRAGERIVHVGCGTGYYTAVLANVVGDNGSVIAVELEPDLAERSRSNLAHLSQVVVICANGSTLILVRPTPFLSTLEQLTLARRGSTASERMAGLYFRSRAQTGRGLCLR